jgi:hypothetical protein
MKADNNSEMQPLTSMAQKVTFSPIPVNVKAAVESSAGTLY